MNLPLISVVIPTTDRTEGLKRCITSVLEQQYCEVQVVIVGNNYKNREIVPALLSSFQSNRIKYYYLDDCENANVARNFGAVNADGEFLAFLDSDDFFLPNHLGCCYKLWKKCVSESVCIFTNFHINSQQNKYSKLYGRYDGDLMKSIFENRTIDFRSSTIFVKRDYFLQIKFDELQFKHQDWAFGLTYEAKFGLVHSETPSVVIVESSGNRMSSNTKPKASIRFMLTYLKEPYDSKFLATRLVDEIRLGSYAGILEYRDTTKELFTASINSMSFVKQTCFRLAISSNLIYSLFKIILSVQGRLR